MIFNSVQYALFLGVVVALYWWLPRRGQNVLIVAASYVFYGAWDARFLSLIVLSTVVDFVVGRQLGREGLRDPARRGWLLVSVGVNLGILGFFKYAGFFATSFAGLLGHFDVEVAPFVLDVVLPVGISFYTFQTLSYTIDVYRRHLEPTDSLLDFAAYVAFFPQLVAGPIERATNLLPQFQAPRQRPDAALVRSALGLIGLGLVLKVAVADAIGPYVDQAYGDPAAASGRFLALATYGFALQVYADFAGYTAIARGSARLLGIELMRNFQQPYLSTNITDFWRTWHMSLSGWLRDYLYVPLGGNRGSSVRTGTNLVLTMLLGGLWHGAGWNFVIWGGLHGLYLVVHRRYRRGALRPELSLRDLPRILATFHVVTFAYIFFRSPTFGDAMTVIANIATWRAGELPVDMGWVLALTALLTLTIDLAQRRTGWQFPFPAWPRPARGLAYGTAALVFLVFSGQPIQPFVYFQF